MRAILETLDMIIVFAFVIALFFVFSGDPDLWDKWHAHAMEQGCATQSNPE